MQTKQSFFLGYWPTYVLRAAILFAVICSCLFVSVRYVHAETHIMSGYMSEPAEWTLAGSPYIVEDPVVIPQDLYLTIDPGVTIIASSSVSNNSAFEVHGTLSLNGTSDSLIDLRGFGGISIYGGTTTINHVNVSLPDGISVFNGFLKVSNSKIEKAGQAIHAKNSTVIVDNSRIANNDYGVFIEPISTGIFQVRGTQNIYGIGGIGNATDDVNYGTVTIASSSIVNNAISAVQNNTADFVAATGNWWGTSTDPRLANDITNSLRGPIAYSPWMMNDPDATSTLAVCCCNILFIPGLEGSRLYKPDSIFCGIGATVNTLWEPNRNADVRKLYLDSTGSSTDATIYSGGPIDKALGMIGIYDSFLKFLDTLSQNGTINSWKAFGYDWRKPITEVVAGAEKKATTTESLLDTVMSLASTSKTGKVTIIAHSYGGLITKDLVKTLSEMGKANIIDTVISVAVPYLGTPEALGAVLHGDDQSMFYGLIATAATMRGLGANMPSVYSLMPSSQYFSQIFSPTIAFASTTIQGLNNGAYPQHITDGKSQNSFVADTANLRSEAMFGILSQALRGNQLMLNSAELIHSILDPWNWPATIARYAIFGWDRSTSKGLEYSQTVVHDYTHQATTTLAGDGTVVAPSAAYNAGVPIAVDLKAASVAEGNDLSHAIILESSSSQQAIKTIITNPRTDQDAAVVTKLAAIPNVILQVPDINMGPTYISVSTHSPVDLNVYDKEGRHTGLSPLPADLAGPDSFFTAGYETKIPGSTFNVAGDEGDPEYEIHLPDDKAETYSVVMKGTGVGEFTFDVERLHAGSYVDKAEYALLPVTPLTVASTTITAAVSESAPAQSFATSSKVLNIDLDGNGTVDLVATSSAGFNPIAYLETIKKTIQSFAGTMPRARTLIARIQRFEDLIQNGKAQLVPSKALQFQKRVTHLKWNNLQDSDRMLIVSMLEQFIAQIGG